MPKSYRAIRINANSDYTGSAFYKTVAAYKWKERDSLAVNKILAGNMPSFLKTFTRINTSIKTSDGKII
ncbi:MAG: hypothetical protein JWQ96_3058, partial [Segetibacter sp.]|nr:hypothetical protein [Segetibacter sp.]